MLTERCLHVRVPVDHTQETEATPALPRCPRQQPPSLTETPTSLERPRSTCSWGARFPVTGEQQTRARDFEAAVSSALTPVFGDFL